MADDDVLARVERAFDRHTGAFERNTRAFERNNAVLDAALERLDRSEEEHRAFMREMILRFEKSDQRMLREWTAFRREMADDRRVHDQAILSILDHLERLGPSGDVGESG
jgi:hypothetical protein